MKIAISMVMLLVMLFGGVIAGTEQGAKFNLITVLYNERNISRCAEYIMCLENNLQHDMLGKIHVLYDDSKNDKKNVLLTYLKTRPVTIHYIHGRPSYNDCFEYANKQMPNAKVILANADIFFDETLNKLKDYDWTNKFFALTRYDVCVNQDVKTMTVNIHGEIRNNIWSQDVWIFSTPLRKLNKNAEKIQIGVMCCDTAIAACAYESGLTVLNPCLSIYCYHLHCSTPTNYFNMEQHYKDLPKKGIPWTMLHCDVV